MNNKRGSTALGVFVLIGFAMLCACVILKAIPNKSQQIIDDLSLALDDTEIPETIEFTPGKIDSIWLSSSTTDAPPDLYLKDSGGKVYKFVPVPGDYAAEITIYYDGIDMKAINHKTGEITNLGKSYTVTE